MTVEAPALLTASVQIQKQFKPGTTGWIAADLDHSPVMEAWLSGHYELIGGVLSEMPPARYIGVTPTGQIVVLLSGSAIAREGRFLFELDIEMRKNTVVRPDVCWVSRDDHHRNANTQKERGGDPDNRFLVPPTLIIESVCQGHERHDRENKFEWYAEFGVQNYWIVDGRQRQLDCFALSSGRYELQTSGHDQSVVHPRLFAPIELPLATCWSDWANTPAASDKSKSSSRPPSSP